jgi:hypothetical protein
MQWYKWSKKESSESSDAMKMLIVMETPSATEGATVGCSVFCYSELLSNSGMFENQNLYSPCINCDFSGTNKWH